MRYIRETRPLAQAEIDWFIQQPSLDAAIETAALAVNSWGKHYSHQRRRKMAALKRAFGALLDKSGAIRKARDFDELFNLVSAALTSITVKRVVEPLLVLDLLESTNTCSCWGFHQFGAFGSSR
jgi:hypothetical protein